MKARTLWRLHPTFDWDVSSAHRPNADYGEMQSYRTATNACFSPEQRTRAFKLAKVYQQTGVVPERDRRFFCYSRFPLSVEDMDTLSAFHPMYRHAVRINNVLAFKIRLHEIWNEHIRAISWNCIEVRVVSSYLCCFVTVICRPSSIASNASFSIRRNGPRRILLHASSLLISRTTMP